MMQSLQRAAWVFRSEINNTVEQATAQFYGVRPINHNAARSGGIGGALWLPSYLRRDATALGLLLLSI